MAYPSQKLYKHYYYILGLPCSASPSAVRSAYRELAMIWHPDKCRSEALAAAGKVKFQEIQEAYAVLSDARKKLLYDNGLYEPEDDEKDIEGMCSLFNEVSSKIAEIKAAEQTTGGIAKNFEEFRELCENIFKTDYQMAHFGYHPPATTDSGYLATHLGNAPTDFSYPTTQLDYPPTAHPKTTSSNNKRDRPLHEGSRPSNIPGNGYLYDSVDVSHASTSAKRKKHSVEQEDHSSVRS